MPLLDGAVADLGRDAILESNWETGRTWTALRTTHTNSLGLWHYVEHATGERELYDLDADPWEMESIHGSPAVVAIKAALAARLAELAIENARARVDASVARGTSGPYKGEGIYRDVVVRKQTIKRTGLSAGKSYYFTVRVRNRGPLYDSITLDADSWGSDLIGVSYQVNGIDVTSAMVKLGSVIKLRNEVHHRSGRAGWRPPGRGRACRFSRRLHAGRRRQGRRPSLTAGQSLQQCTFSPGRHTGTGSASGREAA